MTRSASHYAVLNVPPTATLDEIRAAWRRLAYSSHPDHSPEKAEEFKLAAIAWATLRDPARRASYDKLLAMEAACPTCGGTGVVQKQKGFTKREAAPCPSCGK